MRELLESLLKLERALDTGVNEALSRARLWQLGKIAQGLCAGCGQEPLYKSELCIDCYRKRLEAHKRYYYNNKDRVEKVHKEWRETNPDWQRKQREEHPDRQNELYKLRKQRREAGDLSRKVDRRRTDI